MNPRGGTILGLPAYAALADLPVTPDLAIVALGGAHAAAVVAECGRPGVPRRHGDRRRVRRGRRRGRGAAAGARRRGGRRSGVTLVGPNCMGVLCTSAHLNAVGFVTLRPTPGPLSVISQSGNIGTQLLMTAERRGVGVEKFVSSGNQAATDANDVLEYLAGDPETGRRDHVPGGRRRRSPASSTWRGRRRRASRSSCMRGGLSADGRRAASSHTGAMAGSAEVFAAAARQARRHHRRRPRRGPRRGRLLAYLPLPAGPRVAVVTLGGGWGVLTADALAGSGLQLAELPPDVLAAVDEHLPPYWSHGNPVDLVASVARRRARARHRAGRAREAVDAVLALALIGSPSSGRPGTASLPGESAATATFPAATDGSGPRGPRAQRRETALLAHIAAVMDPPASRSSACR